MAGDRAESDQIASEADGIDRAGDGGNSETHSSERLVPDLDESDAESAYGSWASGPLSASLASSVFNYRYENGRRYHAYRAGQYPLPNDEIEQDRLDLQHHIYKLILGGNLCRAPLANSDGFQGRVLDLGCGTGLWCIEFADASPISDVTGIDLSPIQPTWVPPNCKFLVDDFESDWTYSATEAFDYIHGRALCGSVSDWKRLFSESYRNLKEGGYLELQEYHCAIFSDDDSTAQAKHLMDWADQICEASSRFGKILNFADRIKPLVEEAGFTDVREDKFKVPVGTWAKGRRNKELGMYYRALFVDSIEPFTLALFTRVLGYSAEECQIIAANVKRDLMNPKLHLYVNFHYIWGRKASSVPAPVPVSTPIPAESA